MVTSTFAQFGLSKGTPMSVPDAGEVESGGRQDGFLSEEVGFRSNEGWHVHGPKTDMLAYVTSYDETNKDATNIASLIEEAQKDLETKALITKMKEDQGNELAELRKLDKMEIIGGLKQTFDHLKLIEYLFKDPARAVEEMDKEGMIDKKHLKKYRKDPALLEQDTRRGLYFQFISLAVVGGFIE